MPERDLLAELHEEQCAHGATLRRLDECDRYREALEHIAQSVGARANGQDAKLMARLARETLAGTRTIPRYCSYCPCGAPNGNECQGCIW